MTFIHCLDRFVAAFGSAGLYRRFLLKHLDWLTTFQFHSALIGDVPEYPVRSMGLRFPNRVGLGAGIDLRGERVTGFGALGFGFVEVGPVEKPDPLTTESPNGETSESPKHFLKSAEGFRLRGGIVGLYVRTIEDFKRFSFLYDRADFLVIPFDKTGAKNVCDWRDALIEQGLGRKPLVLELTSNTNEGCIEHEVSEACKLGFDAFQTYSSFLTEDGESCGESRFEDALKAIRIIRSLVPKQTVVFATGIQDDRDALRAREAGANLVCIQTGLFHSGLKLPSDCVKALVEH